uniref:S-methyl-5'-thioadenosine phosphorylase n=1 Tax=Xenopsylla cheopis TaxID=163159 RepID=A0A6M2DNA2_XENCH
MSTNIKVGIIGGSGLDNPDILENREEFTIDTPYGAPSDVLIRGTIKNVPCVLLARHGRTHSIMPSNINYQANIWALHNSGCTHIIVSTATGSLQEHYKPGDLVILDDFIDRTTKRASTFYDGGYKSPLGVCHLPMYPAFCSKSRSVLIDTAKSLHINHHETGTVVTIEGPRFSSRAESNMFKQWGAHVINMTTVPEVVLAKELGMSYAAIALVTDYDCWRDSGECVCVADVLAMFKKNVKVIADLIINSIPNLASQDWTDTLETLKKTASSSVMLPS